MKFSLLKYILYTCGAFLLLLGCGPYDNDNILMVQAQRQPFLNNQIQYRPIIVQQPVPPPEEPVLLQLQPGDPNTAFYAYARDDNVMVPEQHHYAQGGGLLYPNFLVSAIQNGKLLPSQIPLPSINELPIVELLRTQSRFSKIAQILQLDPQMLTAIKSNMGGPITIFAPTNDALGRMPSGALEWLVANPPLLRRFIQTHIVRGMAIMAEDLQDGDQIISLDGTVHYMTQDATGNLEIDEAARIFMAEKDEVASTGIVHGVGNVLLPAGMKWPTGLPKCKRLCLERQRPMLVMPLCVKRCAEGYEDF